MTLYSPLTLPLCFVAVGVHIPDFPPPSFQEATATPIYRMQEIATSDASFTLYHSIQRSPDVDSYPTTSASSPTSQYEGMYDVGATDASRPLPDFPTSEAGSSVRYFPAVWEVERQQGVPLEEQVQREREREQAGTTRLSTTPQKYTFHSRIRSCSNCEVQSEPPTDERRAGPAETLPRRGFLWHRRSQSLSSTSVPSTSIRSRPQTSLKSASGSKRSHKLFARSNKGKDKSARDEPLESWEVLNTGSVLVSQVEISQQPVSRVRRSPSRMNLSTLVAINVQTEAGRNGSIEPYPLKFPRPSATTEKSRPNRSDPPVMTHNISSSPQRDHPPTPPAIKASFPVTIKSFSPSPGVLPPIPSVYLVVSTPDLSLTRPADSRQIPTPPLIYPVAMRPGVRQRVGSMSRHTGAPSIQINVAGHGGGIQTSPTRTQAVSEAEEPQAEEKVGGTKRPEGDQPSEGLETVAESEDEPATPRTLSPDRSPQPLASGKTTSR
jgi:hypothetical protein